MFKCRLFILTTVIALTSIPPVSANTGLTTVADSNPTSVSAAPTPQISLRAQAELETEKIIIRSSSTYKRVFHICSSGVATARLVYATDAAKQVLNVMNLSPENLEGMYFDLKSSDHFLSPLLSHDLQDSGFFAAATDCGLNEDQQKRLVLELITLDLSGKILGGVGVVTFFKYTTRLFKHFWKKAPYTTGTLSAGSAAYAIYEILNKNSTADSQADLQQQAGQVAIRNEQNLNTHFDLDQHKKRSSELAAAALQLVEANLEASLAKLHESHSELEQQKLQTEIQNLENKRTELLRIIDKS